MAVSQDAFTAVTRFGLGAQPGDLAEVSRDPRGWLAAQLNTQYVQNEALSSLPSTMDAIHQTRNILQEQKEGKLAMLIDKIKDARQEMNEDYIRDISAITRASVGSPAPFFERLVMFWRNHFTVSITKPRDRLLVTAFERDAVRPNVLGNFHDMLLASTRHPAMQIYLDNVQSVGPHSRGGERRGKGLNENLAREIMELHTLSVNGGYSQNDVTEFAKILTGWTVDAQDRGDGSGFLFAPNLHEPGPKTIMGVTYPEAGVDEGEEALASFAQSPSTAKFIAAKLARHFIADNPPPAAVNTLQAAFMRNNGELIPVYRTLIDLQETWQTPLSKVKTPNDFILSLLKATGIIDKIPDRRLIMAYKSLNQLPFAAPSPAGWSDRADDWIGAEALLQRIDMSRLVARVIHTQVEPVELLNNTIGPVASNETKFAVAHAGSEQEAIALLFSSPEFQRR